MIPSNTSTARPTQPKGTRLKFLIGGLVLAAAAGYLIISSLSLQQEFFMTIDALMANQQRYTNSKARISGVVLGDTIEYDGHTLSFVLADIPEGTGTVQNEEWENTLHAAATNLSAPRIKVVLVDQPRPDMLRDEAQAIVTGRLGDDGIFYADDLLLKCPTRYEEAAPE
ncbi:MAG: cytochrome c maturation protein CcmE [Anaerolineae bacterium]|nr:cytochrome c maturation protein CcmE [Anaerolineae bacterium]